MPKNPFTFIPVLLWSLFSAIGMSVVALIALVTVLPTLFLLEAIVKSYTDWKSKL